MNQKKRGYLKNNGQKCLKFNAVNIPRSKYMCVHTHTHKLPHVKAHYNHIAESVINKTLLKAEERSILYSENKDKTIKPANNPENKEIISVSTEIFKRSIYNFYVVKIYLENVGKIHFRQKKSLRELIITRSEP